MKLIQAVIFDLDGLMINTEELAFQAWQRTLAPFGYVLDSANFNAMIGLDEDATLAYVQQITGMADGRVVLTRDFRQHMYSLFDTDLKPNPGLLDLVADLKDRGLLLGIASNSPGEHVRRALTRIGLAAQFSALVSRDQVAHGKPAPDPYLTAAQRLNMKPVHCLAVEDSPVGMQSALAAGMGCVVVSPQAGAGPVYSLATARFATLSAFHAALDQFGISK